MKLYSLGFLVLLLLSCEEEDILNQSITEGSLMPLAIGNTWVYQNELLLDMELPGFEDSLIIEIVDEEVISYQGEEYQIFHQQTQVGSRLDLNGLIYTTFLYQDSRGLWSFSMNEDSTEFVEMLEYVRFPVSKGDKWSREVSFNDSTHWTMNFECTSTDTLITTPAGQFSCYRYISSLVGIEGLSADMATYYCPGIGQILQESQFFGGVTVRNVLVDYELY